MDLSEVLGADGLLAESIDGFNFRQQQLDMALKVEQTLHNGEVLVCEAGTGTGKTFAYLVPALLSGLKVIVSTGTRNLQDQLFHRDLPVVKKALAVAADVSLLKGRANYLCIHRMENTLLEGRLGSREMVDQLMQIKRWSGHTRRGDIAELSDIPEDAPIWPLVTSTADNCLGQECSSYSTCHLVEARRRAQEADLVVINHHLLCADFALKEDGFGELLPAVDAFIIDEAHQLPEIASNFFGESISGRQLLELGKDIELENLQESADIPELPKVLDGLNKSVREMRLAFGLDLRRGSWREFTSDRGLTAALEEIAGYLQQLTQLLDKHEGRGKGLDNCLARCQVLLAGVQGLSGESADIEDDIRWFETFRQTFRLNRTPLDISKMFSAQMAAHPGAWVFTSATLAVGESFKHFNRQLGLHEAVNCERWESPFDYPNQALWYVPRGLPKPNEPDYTEAVVEAAIPVFQASRGRAFMLFTSHRALRRAAELLEGRITFPILVQGTASKGELIERFRRLGNAVLLATASFWEGVDVRGDALSCVIIDKLPFASPGDPVLQARIDVLRKRGGNPFMEFQVPQAAIALKQGAGRLIRDEKDRGVLMICDPRLLKKGYGQQFLDSMPPMARTRDPIDVEAFFSVGPDDQD